MSPAELKKTARFILDCEARRDKQGHLAVYRLPAADGGGTFEVAGINDRFDRRIAHRLRDLVLAGRWAEVEKQALAYYISNTDGVAGWSKVSALEAFFRDACFNRGLAGSAKILQIALRVAADGKVGPKTRAALAAAEEDVPALLIELRHACETYERRVAPPVGARAKFWKGLVSRWNKRLTFARSLLA